MNFEHNLKNLDLIIKFIDSNITKDDATVDWEKVNWIDSLYQIKDILSVLPESFKPASEEDLADNFYTAECKCGWWGSSKLLLGGGAIGDTGDHFDVYCPLCGNYDVYEK